MRQCANGPDSYIIWKVSRYSTRCSEIWWSVMILKDSFVVKPIHVTHCNTDHWCSSCAVWLISKHQCWAASRLIPSPSIRLSCICNVKGAAKIQYSRCLVNSAAFSSCKTMLHYMAADNLCGKSPCLYWVQYHDKKFGGVNGSNSDAAAIVNPNSSFSVWPCDSTRIWNNP